MARKLLSVLFGFLLLAALGGAQPPLTPAERRAEAVRAAAAKAEGPKDADAPTTMTVAIISRGGVQFDVWIDGVRHGPTPVVARLVSGKHFLTAGAPGVEPILEDLIVDALANPAQRQTTALTAVPMSDAGYGDVFREVVGAFVKHKRNVHILILAALVTESRDDFEGLKKRIPVSYHEDPLLLLAQSKWEFRGGGADQALRTLELATRHEENLAALWRTKARIYLRQNRLGEALADADRAVHIEARNADNFTLRGDIYVLQGKKYAARLDYERALELDPDSVGAKAGLVEVKRLEGS